MKPSLLSTRFPIAAIAVLMVITTASAQTTFTWNQSGSRDEWDRDENWTPDPGSGGPNGADLATIFDTTSAFTFVDLDEDITVGSITFDDARDYTIEGSNGGIDLTFDVTTGSAAININNTNGDGAHMIDARIILADDLVVTHNSTALFTFSRDIRGTQAFTKAGTGTTVFASANTYTGGTTISAGTLQIGDGGNTGSITGDVNTLGTLAFNRSNNLTYGGVISGTGGLTKLGGGTLTLSSANIFTGNTSIDAGAINLGNSLALQNSTVNVNTANGLVLGGSSGIGGLSGSGDIALGSNSLALGGNNADTTYSGILSGTGGLIKEGTGTLTLTGNNTYSGATIISGGMLELGSGDTSGSITGNVTNNATLTFNRSNNITFTRDISGTGNVIKTGTGDLTIRGANTYSGTTTVQTGSLFIDDGNGKDTENTLANTAVTVEPGASLEFISNASSYIVGSLAGDGHFEIRNNDVTVGVNNESTTFAGSITSFDLNEVLSKEGTGAWTLTGSGYDINELVSSEGQVVIDGVSGEVKTLSVVSNGELDIKNTDIFFDVDDLTNIGTTRITGATTEVFIRDELTNEATLSIEAGASVTADKFRQTNGATTIVNEAELILDELQQQPQGTIAISDASGGTALTIDNSASRTFQGVIEDHSTGPGSMRKAGSGTITLSGVNTYSGTTTIERGALRLGNSLALLNTTVSIDVDDGLEMNGFDATIGGLTGSGNLDLGSTLLTVGNNNASTTYSGIISGTGNVIKIGTGTLTFEGDNTYSGGTTINAGTLQIGDGGTTGSIAGNIVNNGALVFDRSNEFTYSGVISGTGGLTKSGSGALTLSAANTYTGTTTIDAGSIRIGTPFALQNSTVAINVDDGLDLNNSSAFLAGLSGSGNLNIGTNNTLGVGFNNESTTYSGVLSGTGGTFSKAGTGTLTLTGDNTFVGQIEVGGTLQFGDGGTTGSISGLIAVAEGGALAFNRSDNVTFASDIIGTGGVTQNGSGSLSLTGTTTYSGATTINAGSVILQSAAQFANSTVEINTTNGLDLNSLDATLGGLSGSGDLALGSNTLTVGGNGENTTYSGSLSGPGGLTKVGDGRLVLSGNNTFSGRTTIDGGVLRQFDHRALSNTTVVINVDDGLDIFGPLLSIGGLSGSGNLNVKFTQLEVGSNNESTTYSGVISGADGITKKGTGTLILSGDNTYFGGTEISDGTLQLGDGGTTGSLFGDVDNDGTLAFNRSDDVTFSNQISGDGDVSQNGTGSLILTGANTYSGGTTISAGMLQLGDGGTTGSIAGDVVNNGMLVFNRSNDVLFSGRISGSGDVTKLGAGTLVLFEPNTYSGTTSIEAGTVRLFHREALGNSTVTLNVDDGLELGQPVNSLGGLSGSGDLDIGFNSLTVGSNNESTTYSGVLSGTGNVTKTGSGTLTLTGENTLSRRTTVSEGTLQLGDGGTTGSLAGDVTNNGTLAFNRSDDFTYSGDISGTGNVTKTGAGTTTLSGSNTYSGGTGIESGTLRLGSASALGTGNVIIDGGNLDTGGQTLNNAITFGAAGGEITGTGTINADLALNDTSQILAPGNSPGIQSLGVDQTWSAFTYEWEIDNWLGTVAGDDYDQIQIDGELTLTGTTSGSYLLDIFSLTATNLTGDVPNFLEQDQSWLILTTTTGITGFDENFWTLDTSGFTSDPNWQGQFTLSQVGNDLQLDYEAIPEPSTVFLLVLAGSLLLVLRRRNAAP